MPNFLLDANLSPRTGHYLTESFGLDVVSLLELRLGTLRDADIVAMAKNQGRVIITLDEDFGEIVYRHERGQICVIYLRLADQSRATVNEVLGRFFATEAATLDLEHSLVVVSEHRVRIVGPQ